MFVFDLHQHHVCLETHVSPHSAQEHLHASCNWFGDSSHQLEKFQLQFQSVAASFSSKFPSLFTTELPIASSVYLVDCITIDFDFDQYLKFLIP